MVKKCIVPGCNPNYRNRKGGFISDEETLIFRMPRNQEELSRWLKTILMKIELFPKILLHGRNTGQHLILLCPEKAIFRAGQRYFEM